MEGLFDSVYRTAWWAFVCAAGVAWLMMPLIRAVSLRMGAAAPVDERRTHLGAIPQLGGIGMLVAIVGATGLFVELDAQRGLALLNQRQLIVTLVCGAGICLLGAIDDLRDLGWRVKLLGQVALATAAVVVPLLWLPDGLRSEHALLVVNRVDLPFIAPVDVPLLLGIAVVVVWIVAVMNMLNFIDGVDGLAAGQAAIIAGTFAIIAASYDRIGVGVLAAATSGAALGFLPHNWRRGGAKLFMGDSGALLLGFLLAVISVQGVLKTTAAISLVIPLALLAVPILDTTFVVLKRMRHRVSVAHPDRWHLHHRLLNVGLSPRRVAAILWLWTAAMSAVALALRFVDYGNSRNWNVGGLLALGFIVLGALGVSVFLAFQLEILKSRAVRDRNRRIAAEQVSRASDDGAPS